MAKNFLNRPHTRKRTQPWQPSKWRHTDADAPLKAKQKLFVDRYLLCGIAVQAAREAGYGSTPASNETASKRLMARANVRRAIAEGRQQAAEKVGLTQEAVLREIKNLALSRINRAVTWKRDGTIELNGSEEIDDATMAAISEVSETLSRDGRTRKIKLHSKTEALAKAAQHLGLLKERVEVSGPEGGPIEVTSARERLAGRIAGIAARVGARQDPGRSDRG